jgi:hypothetical protein
VAGAVENYGYDRAAPVYYHVDVFFQPPSYPDTDPMWEYNPGDIWGRYSYYDDLFGVPHLFIDGIEENCSKTQSVIEGYLDERLAIPANISITSSGSIDPVGLTGTVNAYIEAVEPIAATDLVVQFALWENNITRSFGYPDFPPYPNSDEILKWAMWDMLPDANGTEIWPSGANVGDKLIISQDFVIQPDWIVDEIGVSIWIQANSTKWVEQAHVELFDDPPTYDIDIAGGGSDTWQFISYPIDASSDVLTVFDDAVWGDGGTDWDYIQWYDPTDAADHWKTYSKDKPPALNDLPDAGNTMGFWVHLTANGGDQILSVGEGNEPSGTTIHLYPGWNMVGYPSTTETYTVQDLIDDSGVVSDVERYNLAAPYSIEPMPGGAPFQRGEAYWIKASADYDWIIA